MPTADIPVALRTLREFAPSRSSVFEDPGDEKSWHQSQRYEGLKKFYEGRLPSWYAAVVRPLAGARRVLDIGAGPALALQELLNQGAELVVGVDRWPGFKREAPEGTRIILHDLTLPMPFLRAGSFDAILSHYVLDYVSPIAMRQVLREAHRLLEPGGRLLLYVSAIGLGANDPTRTSPYGSTAMTDLLREAGFVDLDVQLSGNGRNTIAAARRSMDVLTVNVNSPVEVRVEGDTQLSISFVEATTQPIQIELRGHERSATMVLATTGAPRVRLACCARVAIAPWGSEVQAWAWQGEDLVATQAMRLDFCPTALAIRGPGRVEEVSEWAPNLLSIEPPGNAYVDPSSLTPASEMSEVARGKEGRRLIVESSVLERPAIERLLGDISSRFLARRVASSTPEALDSEWRERRLHAVVLHVSELVKNNRLGVCMWAAQRDVPVLLEGPSWDELVRAVQLRAKDIPSPLALIDPSLPANGLAADEGAQRIPDAVIVLLRTHPNLYLLLSAASRKRLQLERTDLLRARILAGGTDEALTSSDEDEALRYLTERALLMRLRCVNTRPPADIGRRPALSYNSSTPWAVPLVHATRAQPTISGSALLSPNPGRQLPDVLLEVPPASRDSAAVSPTTVFLTIDTEDGFFTEPRMITGEGVGREFGVYGILDELDARKVRATFFINVYECERQPPGVIESVTREIHARGHEVGLHSHQSPNLAFFDRPLFRLSLEEQLYVLQWGADRLQQWTGTPVTSFRAGGYVLNEATFEAMSRVGIQIDSSCCFWSPNNHVQHQSVNSVHRRGSVVEVPVTAVLRVGSDRRAEHRKLDIDWLTTTQLMDGLSSLGEHHAGFAMVMMHSFTFIEKLTRRVGEAASGRAKFTSGEVFGRVAEICGAKPAMRTAFATFLDRVAADPTLRTATLREALPELQDAAARGVPDVVPIVARAR